MWGSSLPFTSQQLLFNTKEPLCFWKLALYDSLRAAGVSNFTPVTCYFKCWLSMYLQFLKSMQKYVTLGLKYPAKASSAYCIHFILWSAVKWVCNHHLLHSISKLQTFFHYTFGQIFYTGLIILSPSLICPLPARKIGPTPRTLKECLGCAQ